jgi:hypothetical protein
VVKNDESFEEDMVAEVRELELRDARLGFRGPWKGSSEEVE